MDDDKVTLRDDAIAGASRARGQEGNWIDEIPYGNDPLD